MNRRRSTKEQRKLADDTRLRAAWRAFHREELAEVLVGLHRDVMARLMTHLKQLRSARELVEFIAAQDWSVVDADTRAIALFEISSAIVKLREQQGLPPFDDPLPGARPSAFQIIRGLVTKFPAVSGEARRAYSVKK